MSSLFSSLIDSIKNGAKDLKNMYDQFMTQHQTEKEKIEGCINTYKSVQTVISGIVSDASGGLTADSIAKLVTDFDGNWDKFAKEFDSLFNSDTTSGHTNMLESFIKDNFGDATFNIGSAIKNKASDALGLYSSSKNLVTSLITDIKSGDITQLATDFDNNWDKWASAVNAVFNAGSSQSQTNILETFAINNFGANVFNTGSIIKNETPNILNAINTFKSGISAFGGSYRDSVEAASRIKAGVDNIVNATEKIANSLNNIVKLIQSHGSMQNANGFSALTTLGKLHETTVGKAVNTTLRVGAGAAAVVGDVGSLASAVKSGDVMSIYASGKQLYDDVKTLTKDNLKSGKLASVINRNSSSSASTSSVDSASSSSEGAEAAEEDKKEEADSGASDSYVCSGATMKCSFGSSQAKLTIYPDRTVYFMGQPMGNITDHVSMYNIASFGLCRTTSYPPTGAATSANHGKLTPRKCVPGTKTNWQSGKDDVLVQGNPALLKTSYCKCCYGGIITITNDGQK